MVEAVRNVKDLDACTSTKLKNRAFEPERYAGDPSDVSDAENCQKGKVFREAGVCLRRRKRY